MKLSRLSINWQSFPEMFRRYWDQVCNVVEGLNTSTAIPVSSLSSEPAIFRNLVNDANSTTFGAIVVGGGANTVPVYFDGTNWRIG